MSVVSSVSDGFIHGFRRRWRILVAKTKDFWWRIMDFWQRLWIFWQRLQIFWQRLQIFLFRQCWHCILMREVPPLSMCTHTNEGIPSTEHVQMLHWACADMLMRGNPVTDWTHYTHNWNPNRQCLPHITRGGCMADFSPFTVVTNIFVIEFSETFRKNSNDRLYSCQFTTSELYKCHAVKTKDTEFRIDTKDSSSRVIGAVNVFLKIDQMQSI